MLKAKYQAHKLINVIFYIIVFLVGFYMGVVGQKIGLKDIFSKILMIDTVKAESVSNEYFTRPTSDTWYNTQLINKLFDEAKTYLNLDISLSNYLNIYAYTHVEGVFNNNNNYQYLFSTTPYTASGGLLYSNGCVLSLNLDYHGSSTSISHNCYNGTNSIVRYRDGISYLLASNLGYIDHTVNYTLNFSNYNTFNENLFANNNDFKHVCINPKNAFAISTTYSEYSNPSDFLWFPYQIVQLNSGLYHTVNRNFVWNDETKHVFFNSYNLIDDYFLSDIGLQMQPWVISSNLTYLYTYDNRYNYYGWNAYPFTINDITSENPIIPIFKFSDSFSTLQLSSFGISHGGSTRHHYDLSDENNQNLQMCFYINKMYDITELNIDENGNFYGSIDNSNGTIDIYSETINNLFTTINDDLFGFTSILTAPLTAIKQISNGTCNPVSIPILGKTITLPCGDTIFWGREDVQDFKIFWNMFFGGVICYGLGVSTFKRIQKFKDPNSDKIEVIDL